MLNSYKNKKFCIITLGCPKNQVDSEVLAGQLSDRDLVLVNDADEADVILINTCGFIEDAKQESIDTILEALRYKDYSHHKEVYVWGCLSQRYKGEIEKEIPEVDGYFGIEPFEQMGRFFLSPDFQWIRNFHVKRILTTPAHVAYLKIAEGCNHRCTFCAIPQFKGPYRSRSMDSLIREAELLAEKGVKELILIAQDTTNYGSDLTENITLTMLLERLTQIHGIEWIRLMYAHPNHISRSLIDVMAKEEKICKYLDMPLQHISEPVLNAMGRGGNRSSFERLIDQLKQDIPGLVLRSTFIVGFPNESEKDFEQLLSFIRHIRFNRLGAFIYSSEEGTAAFQYGSPVMKTIAQTRYTMLMEEQQEISLDLNLRLVGTVQRVIIDDYDKEQDLYLGRTQGDALEIDQNVWVKGQTDLGKIVHVRVESCEPYDLFGRIEEAM